MRLLLGYRHFPVSIAKFFKAALRREGHSVVSAGPYSTDAGIMAWHGGLRFPHHVDQPEVELPWALRDFPLNEMDTYLDLRQFDAAVSFDAGFRLSGRGPIPSILYGTDPHSIPYQDFCQEYDVYLSAQRPNLDFDGQGAAMWVPLGYDPTVHRFEVPLAERAIDVCFVGVFQGPAYARRREALAMLAATSGVYVANGLIYEDYVATYNQAKIAFNMSASWDIPMRFFEAFGMGCCNLTNRMPFLADMGFVEGEHYAAYDSPRELLEKADWLLRGGHWQHIAEAGRQRALELDCTYDGRVRTMVDLIARKLVVHA